MIGETFHYWTVKDKIGSNAHKKLVWLCECKCGTEREVVGSDLRNGKSKSCGCYQQEVVSKEDANTNKPEYAIWCAMKTRCTNENAINYNNYGGRGITVCDKWLNSFEEFYADMGNCNGLTIERIDTNGNYEPSNCRWATRKEQANNKRSNLTLEFKGIVKTVKQWSEETGINYDAIRRRIKLGWSVEAILTTPTKVGRNQWQ